MKKIASVRGYDISEVTKEDSKRIRDMFSGTCVDAGTGIDASHMWDLVFEPALEAIERGRDEDYLSRYPYEDGMSAWDKACMRHPLFVISARRPAEYKNILFVVPPAEMESAYITDNGEYWGDDRWEPLPDIVGSEQLANDILDEIYGYIRDVETPLKESRISRNAATARRRSK